MDEWMLFCWISQSGNPLTKNLPSPLRWLHVRNILWREKKVCICFYIVWEFFFQTNSLTRLFCHIDWCAWFQLCHLHLQFSFFMFSLCFQFIAFPAFCHIAAAMLALFSLYDLYIFCLFITTLMPQFISITFFACALGCMILLRMFTYSLAIYLTPLIWFHSFLIVAFHIWSLLRFQEILSGNFVVGHKSPSFSVLRKPCHGHRKGQNSAISGAGIPYFPSKLGSWCSSGTGIHAATQTKRQLVSLVLFWQVSNFRISKGRYV